MRLVSASVLAESDYALEIENVTVKYPEKRGLAGVLLYSKWFPALTALLLAFTQIVLKLARLCMVPLRICKPGIRLRHELKQFQKVATVLEDVSLKVKRGTCLVIIGLNGAGKSTLLSCIANLLRPLSGDIRLFGKSIYEFPEMVGKTLIRSNSKELNGEFTAVENVEFLARLFELDRLKAKDEAIKLFKALGLSSKDYGKKQVSRLSLGTKAKVALVRALVLLLRKDTEGLGTSQILVLDEPTLGLDVTAVKTFLELLTKVRELFPSLTIILATNDPREVVYGDASIVISKDMHSLTGGRLDFIQTLNESMSVYALGVETMARMIDGRADSEEAVPAKPLALEPVSSANCSVAATLWWRLFTDLSHGWLVTVAALMGIVVPQLMGLFGSAASFGAMRSWVCGVLGIYASLLIREMMRILDRERNWYKSIESVLTSPVPLHALLWDAVVIGTIVQCVYTALSALILGSMIFLPDAQPLVSSLAQVSSEDVAGVIAVLACSAVAAVAIGLMLSVVPFLIRPDVAFLMTNVIPCIVVLLSEVFTPASALPGFLQPVMEVNPFSFAANALVIFLHCGKDGTSVEAWTFVRALAVESAVLLGVSLAVFKAQFDLVLRSGGMRSAD